jgi:hypothetical protein
MYIWKRQYTKKKKQVLNGVLCHNNLYLWTYSTQIFHFISYMRPGKQGPGSAPQQMATLLVPRCLGSRSTHFFNYCDFSYKHWQIGVSVVYY